MFTCAKPSARFPDPLRLDALPGDSNWDSAAVAVAFGNSWQSCSLGFCQQYSAQPWDSGSLRPSDCPHGFISTIDRNPGVVFFECAQRLRVASRRMGSDSLHDSQGRSAAGIGGAGGVVGACTLGSGPIAAGVLAGRPLGCGDPDGGFCGARRPAVFLRCLEQCHLYGWRSNQSRTSSAARALPGNAVVCTIYFACGVGPITVPSFFGSPQGGGCWGGVFSMRRRTASPPRPCRPCWGGGERAHGPPLILISTFGCMNAWFAGARVDYAMARTAFPFLGGEREPQVPYAGGR